MATDFIELSEVLAISYPEYLSHHGILGQKWGVRRYQNKDGSLTAAGKKRYDSGGDQAKLERPQRKRIKDMTDAELRQRTERMRLENQYRDQLRIENQYRDPSRMVNKGRRVLDSLSEDTKTILALSSSVIALGKLGSKVLKDHPEIVNTTLKLFKKKK